ncbi:MAG: UvrD-helicase domain-containing protein, partial [Pseudomonadales bacterium]|nr:UvrD-helicase domain-containing protein [Pseudomonadales bacterium]
MVKPLVPETFPVTGHRIIEASAGTGKTYTITNLYLRLLLGDPDQPRPFKVNEILVLTFTVAATEELRRRVRERVVEARQALRQGGSDDPFLDLLAKNHSENGQRLLTAALQLMDEASIFTIHGFCARVLKEQSFETGMLFDQETGT